MAVPVEGDPERGTAEGFVGESPKHGSRVTPRSPPSRDVLPGSTPVGQEGLAKIDELARNLQAEPVESDKRGQIRSRESRV